MRHFSSEEWVDFVRNALKANDKQKMRAHLQTGCQGCTGALAIWTQVNEMAIRQSAYVPPTATVEAAKTLMIAQESERSTFARLIFDSWRAPALVGLRSGSAVPRQMLYGFEDYRVDLRLEPKFDADQVLLVGQILQSARDAQDLGAVGVTLMRGARVLGLAQTNKLGEFELECDLAGRLDLLLTLSDGIVVKIPIIESSSAQDQSYEKRGPDFKTLSTSRLRNSKRTRN